MVLQTLHDEGFEGRGNVALWYTQSDRMGAWHILKPT